VFDTLQPVVISVDTSLTLMGSVTTRARKFGVSKSYSKSQKIEVIVSTPKPATQTCFGRTMDSLMKIGSVYEIGIKVVEPSNIALYRTTCSRE